MNFLCVIFALIAGIHAVPMPQQSQTQISSPQKQSQRVQDDKVNHNKVLQSPTKTQNQNDKKHGDDQMAAASSIAQDKEDHFGSSTVLENPHYNPNLYHSFIPADAVQQYMSYFNPQYAPQYTPDSGPAASASQVIPYAVQTGYEGYIVPEYPTQIVETYPGLLAILKGLIPKFFLAWIVKSAAVVLTTLGVVFFGGALTTAICSLTPLCTIRFSSLPIFKWKTAAEEVGKAIGAELTNERVRRAAEFLQEAIQKFSKLQETDFKS